MSNLCSNIGGTRATGTPGAGGAGVGGGGGGDVLGSKGGSAACYTLGGGIFINNTSSDNNVNGSICNNNNMYNLCTNFGGTEHLGNGAGVGGGGAAFNAGDFGGKGTWLYARWRSLYCK